MSLRNIRSQICIILLASLLGVCLPSAGKAVSYSFGLHPDKERLVFTFPDEVPAYSVNRTGREQLAISMPGGTAKVTGARPDLGGAKIVRSLRPVASGATIDMGTDAFGYVAFKLDNPPRLVVDVFRDPLGTRWQSPGVSGNAPATERAPRSAPQKAQEAEKPERSSNATANRTTPRITRQAQNVANGTTPKVASKRPEPPRTQRNATAATPKKQETPAKSHVVSRRIGDSAGASRERSAQPERRRVAPAQKQDAAPNVFRRRIGGGDASPEVRQRIASAANASALRPSASNTMVTPDPLAPPRAPKEGNASGVKQQVADLISSESRPWAVRGRVSKDGSPVTLQPYEEEPAPLDANASVATVKPESALPQPQVKTPEPESVAMQEPEASANATNATKGPDFKEVMVAAQTALAAGEYDSTLEHLDILTRDRRVPKDMKEEALYMRADALYSKYTGKLDENFDEVNGAYETAMNFNLDSNRVPAALLKRGVLNLHVENVPEASAFFNILRKKHPNDLNVPLTYYYWGDYYFKKKNYQRAADEFQYLVQVYPDSQFVREASLGLARSLRELGYDKQAFQIVDFIEKRWPRYYIEFPPFLQLQGDSAYSVNNFENAKDYYWSYYNIDPQGDDADVILARIGDIYVKTGHPEAAREVYERAVTEFPDREGGLVSKMRLAEEGIYDQPTLEDMYSVFDRPLNLKPSQIYREIIADHPESALAPLAQLKLAIWQMWNKKYLDAIASTKQFVQDYPDSELKARALDVGSQSFSMVVEPLVREENYPMILKLWKENDFLRDKREELSPGARMALALSFWKRGEPARALDIVMPFMKQDQMPEASEMAMSLALSVYLENQAWGKVLEVADDVKHWELTPDHRRELRYAQALAYENLGNLDKSRPLWMELGMDRQLDEQQRAYALYFMALEAEEKNQLKQAYNDAQEALDILLRLDEDKSKIRDSLRLLMDVTERSGRVAESLNWASQYEKHIDKDDPSLPALHYRMAGLHKKLGDMTTWRDMLRKLADSSADALYSRMAASDLQLDSLEQATRPYQPDARMQ